MFLLLFRVKRSIWQDIYATTKPFGIRCAPRKKRCEDHKPEQKQNVFPVNKALYDDLSFSTPIYPALALWCINI